MKVFISWSGHPSKELGEAVRDWIPKVLQRVKPYFTPADIDKGARWLTDIAKELEESKIGILCVTRDNIHSDWMLFEAGALSKSLDDSRVCPVLFGISSTDLAGPLEHFQATEFKKKDIRQLLDVINDAIGEKKLASGTLDAVFEKWWPDLETQIGHILAETGETDETDEPIRSDRELLEEVLELSRSMTSRLMVRQKLSPAALRDLLRSYIALHNSQIKREGGYQATLDYLQDMRKPVSYILRRSGRGDKHLDKLLSEFRDLSYSVSEPGEEDGDLPF
ncbi:MAG: toll/interleukin-1 receptor domain-containing protein [Gemmatimonadetes bacterium]|nr:toll/interleukin-1 receptor domain-containing protein [Gemmatimonadota bacterium]MYG22660.1 toll/interleukin-1 receptor domain-containing protein [Gemmatimonadota bacterium]MYJ39139.1 toll/interleukin-1 receptor domain-containing protein [Gemmatimonadota bacterium]